MNVRVEVLSVAPARIKVEGRRAWATRIWSFRNFYASVSGLGERIENLTLADDEGQRIKVKRLAPGEYEASGAATRWSCEIKLDAPEFPTDAAHVSWLTGERGFLMMGDLLPLAGADSKSPAANPARLSFALPAGWSVASGETKLADGRFETMEADNAVFFIGPNLRQRSARVGAMQLTLLTDGTWAFTDEDVSQLAVSILKDYTRTTGLTPRPRATLMLAPFPNSVGAGRWSAETRSGNVLLLSGRSPSKTAGLAQLSVPLTHELFHLWIPNGINLDGQYDWFYEGFTLYQALRAGMRLNFLSFQDYLNALARAYDAYAALPNRTQFSLIEAARRRWTGTTALVYNKGMLVAFLYDLSLRQSSKGKRSLDDVYRDLFRSSGTSGVRQDGNEAVVAALKREDGVRGFVERYIESNGDVDLSVLLPPFGLRGERIGAGRTIISVSASPTRRQRDLLGEFGYNENSLRTGVRRSSK